MSAGDDGTSQYTVHYSYPDHIDIGPGGANITVVLTVTVDSLTGLKLFVRDYTLDVLVTGPNGTIAHGQNSSAFGSSSAALRNFHTGARIGPVAVQAPINTLSIHPGQTVAADVSVGLISIVWHDFPSLVYLSEGGSQIVGKVDLSVPPAPIAAETYLIPGLILGAAAASIVLFYVRRASFRRRST